MIFLGLYRTNEEQLACTFVKFSDIAKKWPFVTLISVDPSLDPKTFDTMNYLKMLLTSVVKTNWSEVGAYMKNMKNDKIAQHI